MEDGTCFEMVRNTAHSKCYWQSSLQPLPADSVFGTFTARYWDAPLWLVTMSNLMPLFNCFHVSALTKASTSLNIIPVCIFHSCLGSKENICLLRSVLCWQGNDAEHYSCYKAIARYHFFPVSCKKWGGAQSIAWNKPTPHQASLPHTGHKQFLDLPANTS